jgi:hypothetical protein
MTDESKHYHGESVYPELKEKLDGLEVEGSKVLDVGVYWDGNYEDVKVNIGIHRPDQKEGRRYWHHVCWPTSMGVELSFNATNAWDDLPVLEEMINDHLGKDDEEYYEQLDEAGRDE